MRNHPNIDLLTGFMEEIEYLKQARRLLEELWFTTNAEDCVKFELSHKINTYFELNQDE